MVPVRRGIPIENRRGRCLGDRSPCAAVLAPGATISVVADAVGVLLAIPQAACAATIPISCADRHRRFPVRDCLTRDSLELLGCHARRERGQGDANQREALAVLPLRRPSGCIPGISAGSSAAGDAPEVSADVKGPDAVPARQGLARRRPGITCRRWPARPSRRRHEPPLAWRRSPPRRPLAPCPRRLPWPHPWPRPSRRSSP